MSTSVHISSSMLDCSSVSESAECNSNVTKKDIEDCDFLSRNCTVPTEETVGQIQGKIPDWLEGTLIRNGPGMIKVGESVYNNLLDGLAVLQRFNIKNGKVVYTCRALKSETYNKNMAANRIVVSELGTAAFPDPCKTIFQKIQTTFQTMMGNNWTDNCNVSVGYFGDQLYAMNETNVIRRINPEDLHTIGNKTNISDYVALNQATAHPHVCEDGTVFNMGNNYRNKRGPHYVVFKIPPTFDSPETCYNNVQIVAEIPVSNTLFPSYYHSFGITGDKLIFIESPWRLDILKLFKAIWNNNSIDTALVWKNNLKTRFYVVSLHSGKIHPVVYQSDGFFAFHHVNAYEEDGQIVVDVAGYDRVDMLYDMIKNPKGESRVKNLGFATTRRYVLPLNVQGTCGNDKDENLVTLKDVKAKAVLSGNVDGKPTVFCTPHHLTQNWVELPRINYRFNGEKYTYFYGVSASKSSTWTDIDLLTKVDVRNNASICWSEEGMVPHEPIFVANPNSTNKDEDDGVILSTLINKKEETKATLIVLNAKDMKELARVQFNTEGPFTSTFHGQWANQADKIHLL